MRKKEAEEEEKREGRIDERKEGRKGRQGGRKGVGGIRSSLLSSPRNTQQDEHVVHPPGLFSPHR